MTNKPEAAYKLVPVEPTPDMERAFFNAGVGTSTFSLRYQFMIAAAPQVQQEPARLTPEQVEEVMGLAKRLRAQAFSEGIDNERPHASDSFYRKAAQKTDAVEAVLRAKLEGKP